MCVSDWKLSLFPFHIVVTSPCTALLVRMRTVDKMAAGRKVLITGASGLLGRELLQHFKVKGWEYLGLAYTRAREGLVKVDLCQRNEVENVLDDFKPHVVVHAAAERRPDVVSKQTEQAQALNVGATEILTQLCQERGTFLIYISTDYVFDGKHPPYTPSASTNPLNTYGITKRDGEMVVCKYKNVAVLRVPVLYGEVESLSESAVTIIFTAVLNTTQPAQLSDYEQRYPTHVQDVAEVCQLLAGKQLAEPGTSVGIWHCSGDDRMTKYSMACAMGRLMGLSTGHITPVREPSSGAPRPYDSQLDCSSTRTAFPSKQTPFDVGIRKVLESHVPK